MLRKLKKYIVPLGTLLCVQCASVHYDYPSDLEHGHINGPVNIMRTLFYETDSATGKEKLVTKTVELFNEHGSSPSDTIRNLITGEEIVNVLSFNANTSMNRKTTFINGNEESTMQVIYNAKGKMTRINILNSKDALQEYYLIDQLSAKGDIDVARHYDANGKLLESFYNKYDNFTRTSARNVDTLGKVTYQDTVEVNEKKWPVRSMEYNNANNYTTYDTLEYKYDSIDHYGNWQIKTTLRGHHQISREVRHFTYITGN